MRTPHLTTRRLARLTALSFGLTTLLPAHAALDIPNVPLQTSITTEPNIMMILDDSGSMQFEIMPENLILDSARYIFPRENGVYGGNDYTNYVPDLERSPITEETCTGWGKNKVCKTTTTYTDNPYGALARSPQKNSIYYNPEVTYLPWSKPNGSLYANASISCAPHNPMDTSKGCRDFTAEVSGTRQNSVRWIRCSSANDCSTSSDSNDSSRTYWPATYFWHNGGDVWSLSSYTKTEIKPGITSYSGHNRNKRTDCTAGVCTYTQEIQNFANWYTYYRSRVLTARAGVGRAFSAQDTGLRVGFGTINKASSSVDGVDTGVIISGVRKFEETDRTQFFKDLYERVVPNAGTPLLGALNAAGKYYQRTDDKGPWSTTPGQTGGSDLSCRQSYTILMTDGYYSDSISGFGNADNTDGEEITGVNSQKYTYKAKSPFKDSASNTLADVAMHYWKNDLRTNINNAVPTSSKDPAFWQHMVTFTVGLGVTGSIDPNTAFNAINNGSAITWPGTGSDSGKIDDLLHAAVNGRGAFFSAQNPTEFAQALTAMLKDIVERKGSAASVTVTGNQINSNSMVFVPKYDPAGWVGELEARRIAADGTTTFAWKASIPSASSRKIYTVTGGNKREFNWSSLSSTDRTALGSEDIVNYLRGDQSKETKNGGSLRTRSSLLGDIHHSSPVYDPDTKTVYVGANDGMLHAFNSETGVERFAFVPSAVIPNLKEYSDSAYQHRFYVDGELTLVRKRASGLDKTYLVGSLGLGGKGVFALDVTDPASFSANNIAWEYTSNTANTDSDLGLMLGSPTYAKLNSGDHAILMGNGYNSSSGKAALYVFKLTDGSVIRKFIPDNEASSGMAAPGEVDLDGNGTIDRVYAGDLKGNVWKFNLNSSSSSGWSGSNFFIAKAPDGTLQPITSKITSATNYLLGDDNVGKRFVFFGTGSYFQQADLNDKSVQSLYGLIDDGTEISSRANLKERGFESTTTLDGKPARIFKDATRNADGKVTDMQNKQGWFLDWVVGDDKKGERVVTTARVYRLTEPTLIVSSIIPEAEDPCQPGGTGYVNVLNAFTGGSLKEPFFNGNLASGGIIGSLDLGIGMPSEASLMMGDGGQGVLIVGGSNPPADGGTRTIGFKTNRPPALIYWREIR